MALKKATGSLRKVVVRLQIISAIAADPTRKSYPQKKEERGRVRLFAPAFSVSQPLPFSLDEFGPGCSGRSAPEKSVVASGGLWAL